MYVILCTKILFIEDFTCLMKYYKYSVQNYIFLKSSYYKIILCINIKYIIQRKCCSHLINFLARYIDDQFLVYNQFKFCNMQAWLSYKKYCLVYYIIDLKLSYFWQYKFLCEPISPRDVFIYELNRSINRIIISIWTPCFVTVSPKDGLLQLTRVALLTKYDKL